MVYQKLNLNNWKPSLRIKPRLKHARINQTTYRKGHHMKRIQTSKLSRHRLLRRSPIDRMPIPAVGLPQFIYASVVCVLIAAFSVSPGVADDKPPNVTLVYDHALPNVPGKSMKGVLVEYGPGDASRPRAAPAPLPTQCFFTHTTCCERAQPNWGKGGGVFSPRGRKNLPGSGG